MPKHSEDASGRCPECWGENGEHLFNCSRFYDPRPEHPDSTDALRSEASDHVVRVWRRVSEGSATAECSCGWKGPKRTYAGGAAHDDADDHTWEMQRENAYAQEAVRD